MYQQFIDVTLSSALESVNQQKREQTRVFRAKTMYTFVYCLACGTAITNGLSTLMCLIDRVQIKFVNLFSLF